ncbi:MAG: type II toxin-antitoxin system HicB family antitoxin [Ignavibacteriales bacterium]|nr:type II toxin-antitoxin system HicB family antitoxin [Ignavibacteriales bacterium]
MKKYLVVYEKTKTGFSAYSPDLPGCVATGKTKRDTEKRIYEAIQFHLQGLIADKQKIPVAKSESEFLVFN